LIRELLPGGTILAVSTHLLQRPVRPEEILSSLRQIAEAQDVQAFDTMAIAGFEHLRAAAVHALRAKRSAKMIARNIGMELLVYASAQRQIEKAIRLVGIREASVAMTVAILSQDEDSCLNACRRMGEAFGPADDEALNTFTVSKIRRIKSTFNITDGEIRAVRGLFKDTKDALTSLVLERIALVATGR